MHFINDPIECVLQAASELYPDINPHIQFDPDIKVKNYLLFRTGCWGMTWVDEDGTTIISISTHLKVKDTIEIIAHEIAHAVAGIEDGHGDDWEDAFDRIQCRYLELMFKDRK